VASAARNRPPGIKIFRVLPRCRGSPAALRSLFVSCRGGVETGGGGDDGDGEDTGLCRVPEKVGPVGSVCISRKTTSSCRQRSITLAAIFVRHDMNVSFAQLVLDGTAAGNAPRFCPPGKDSLLRLPRRWYVHTLRANSYIIQFSQLFCTI
jgi:hypothetical protein